MGYDVFNDPIIGNLIGKARPEEIAQSLYQAGSPSRITNVYKILDNPEYRAAIGNPAELKAVIQNGWASNAFLRSTPKGTDFAEPSGKQIMRATTHSRGTFEATFPDKAMQESIKIGARAIEITQSRVGEKAGTIFFQLKQAGAAGQAATAAYMGFRGVSPTAIGILAFPTIAAIPLTSRRVVNFMMQRALSKEARRGVLQGRGLGQYMVRLIDAAREDGIPFTYIAPDGQETKHDPKAQGSQIRSPLSSNKPQSKQ